MMASVIDASLSHGRTVISTLVLLLIAGSFAFFNIAKEAQPDIDIPVLYVSVSLEGVSPEDSERLLLRPLEQELSSIEGLKELKSTAYQGGGFVLLEFTAGFNKDTAMDDVRQSVDQAKPDLPVDAEEPTVTEVNTSLFPVLVVTLSGDVPIRTLISLAEDVQDRLESVSSILEAPIAGKREDLVEILVDPDLVESYNLNGPEIIQFFDRSNRLVAAGNLDTGAGSFAIEVPGLFETVEDIMEMPIKTAEDSSVTVRDIAEIRKTYKDPQNFAHFDGKPAIAIEVVKRSGENIIETIETVRRIVDEESGKWPEGVEVNYIQDQSDDIRQMISDLQNNVISAVLLVMIVIVAAMGLRAAGLVGIAIPGAFLTGILVLYAMGLTVNIVVLFSLILSVGMLVDGAIVVTEFADRKMAEGMDRKEAYANAAKRMAWPITTSTATTLSAFAPLLFWPDIVGEFMKFLPITLIAVLASSLFMALVFVPTLGSLIGKPGAASDPKLLAELAAAETGNVNSIQGFTGKYISTLNSALSYPFLVLVSTILLLITTMMLYGKYGSGVEFFPEVEPEVASVLVHARGNLSIYEKDTLVSEVENRILEIDGIKTIYTRTGNAASSGSELAEDVIGQIQLEFEDWQVRKPATEILDEIIRKADDLAGLFVETRKEEAGPPTGKDIQVEISSNIPAIIPDAVERVRGYIESDDDFIAVEDSRPIPGIDWEYRIDRAQAAKFGVDVTTIGFYIRMVTNGLEVAEYRPDESDDEIDIVLRHREHRRTLDQLERVRVFGNDGYVPISSFVTPIPRPATGNINRSGQKRIITVKADVREEVNVTAKINEIKAWLSDNRAQFDPRLEIAFKGQDEDQQEAQEFLVQAFFVAIFVMGIILVTQFNSFYSAFVILWSVVMSTIGVMLGLLITGQAFSIVMTGIGIIALAGVVVNNNIVLIDTFDHMRRTMKAPIRELILRTGAQRLRPVMLTTITTALGLLPMVLQMNIDFITREVTIGAPSTQWWVQLSTAVVFGLIFSTVLTLVVTPCMLMVRENFGNALRKLPGRTGKAGKSGILGIHNQ